MAAERKLVTEKIRRVLLREFLMEETKRAGFGGLDIQRTPMGTRVTLIAERPGLVIGRKGGSINALTEAVQNRFKFDNPQIEVQEVENAALNAQIMAEKLANALERGWHFRRAGHSTVRRIMAAGAKGCLIVVAGKLTGQRHRTQKFKSGHIKYCGEPSYTFMHKGFAIARLKPGVIGVTVAIMDPKAKLPDDIEVAAASEAPIEAPAPVALDLEPEVPAVLAETEAPAPEAGEEEPAAGAPPEEPKKKPRLKKEKVADKKVKKVLQGAKELGVEVDVDAVEGEEK